jgi:UDP-N-acetylglucosamine 2-epimerase (non-hydrolysing)
MAMKLLLVAGARPNFMKIASIVAALDAHNLAAKKRIDYLLIHTGQHYDEKMSQTFFRELDLPRPAVDLEVGSGTHAAQTAEIMKRFEPVLVKERPDAVLLVGDVNSTIACALVAAKISYQDGTDASDRTRPLIVHVEAGLRSKDRSMPEEINRILTDALSDLLFVTEESAVHNLRSEGIARNRIHLVGNTMVDTLLRHRDRAGQSAVLQRLGLAGSDSDSQPTLPYGVVTLHRPSNVDDPAAFRNILDALLTIGKTLPLVFPVHPRTVSRIQEFGLADQCHMLEPHETIPETNAGVYFIEPLGYLHFLRLMSKARIVLTDSGGIQEETTMLGVPCVTLRNNTERPVTVSEGTNVLAGTSKEAIVRQAIKQLKRRAQRTRPRFWDGKAGQRIVKILSKAILATNKS